ncbi:MAG: PIN domain-containing protein [archaeon]
MELVADSNRIIASLIKDGYSRRILLSRKFSFFTVAFGLKEVMKYKALIKKKAKINEDEFNSLMNKLMSKITVLSEKDISEKSIGKAIAVMGKIDVDDVVFIALSIELENIPIWSDDKHFNKQNKIKIYTTKQLVEFL